MFAHNWLMWPAFIWLFICYYAVGIDGQSQHAIGAHRVFMKTSFSCTGRPAGYYADVETGCQVYHMCDELGRQFSYSCPNTTLFQQRMLICDHWYMVNCSRSEGHYGANLLIGQRDKPFVNDEENSLRTPRPDLLDRPYAPDYSGESFRNQYKQLPAIQNQISDLESQKSLDKHPEPGHLAPGQQRWKIPPPSRTILPPAYEPQTSEEVTPSSEINSVRFIPTTVTPLTPAPTTRRTTTRQTTRRTTTTTTTTYAPPSNRRQLQINGFNSAALHSRQTLETPLNVINDHDDLGTSHSTRYNTSGDYNSAEVPFITKFNEMLNKKERTTTTSTTSTIAAVKLPSKIYEPPFLYPIYNENDTRTTETPLRISSATPFTASPVTRSSFRTTTPIPPLSRPTTLAGKPFTTAHFSSPTRAPAAPQNNGRQQNQLLQQQHRFDVPRNGKDARTPTPAQGFKPPTPRPPVKPVKSDEPESSPFDYKIPTTSRLHLPTPVLGTPTGSNAALPAKELLPPFQDIVLHDTATTQGPPIYYEWKVPSNGLEPPKLDPPIGVDGREYPEAIADYNSISGTADNDDQQKAASTHSSRNALPAGNPFLPTRSSAGTFVTTRTPISRSIKETAQPNSVFRINAGSKAKSNVATTDRNEAANAPVIPSDINELRKELAVPEFAFPLEPIGRTGYLSTDAYNSFQLKLPDRRSDEKDDHAHWFGENPQCPECHPSFVVPGTCEPCLRR